MFKPTVAFHLLHSFLPNDGLAYDYKAPHAYRGTPQKVRRPRKRMTPADRAWRGLHVLKGCRP